MMNISASDILFIFTVLALIPSIIFIVELIIGTRSRPADEYPSTGRRCAILMPAHNEELVIERALQSIESQLAPGDRIIVIADNCDDATAEIARRHQCEVLVRNDKENRGKGFALAYGLEHLAQDPPDMVMILDADCEATPGSISALKAACAFLNQPVQANYQMRSGTSGNVRSNITEFAVYIKNHVRLAGLDQLGGSVPITGSGFAVPYHLLEKVDLASGEIVEDMKLGIDLALGGNRVRYVPDALITSPLPTSEEAATTQHKRWEHGHVSMIIKYFPALIRNAIAKRSWSLLMTALDLGVPPFLVLTAFNICLFGVVAVLDLYFWDFRSSALILSILVSQMIVLLVVNRTADEARLESSDVISGIHYLTGKMEIYKSLLKRKKSGWVKTGR